MFPQGFYRANPAVAATFDAATGAPLGPAPGSDPLWPGFIRYRVAPRSALPELQPSMQRADWYGYCGPGAAGTAGIALKWLTDQAFQAGLWLYGEFVHIHPHTIPYPWPTWQLTCYPWQAELRRPRAFRATWNGQTFKYALNQTADEGPEGRIA